jgi:hypothetical protein
MLLGTIMAELKDERQAEAALLSLGDLTLIAAVEAERNEHQESLGEYVSGAAQRFARLASDEEWLALMTAIEKAENPAGNCLRQMLNWSVSRDQAGREEPVAPAHTGCTCGGSGGCHGQS